MFGHLGMIPLINHGSRVRENSEVVIIYADSWIKLVYDGMLIYHNIGYNKDVCIYVYIYIPSGNLT